MSKRAPVSTVAAAAVGRDRRPQRASEALAQGAPFDGTAALEVRRSGDRGAASRPARASRATGDDEAAGGAGRQRLAARRRRAPPRPEAPAYRQARRTEAHVRQESRWWLLTRPRRRGTMLMALPGGSCGLRRHMHGEPLRRGLFAGTPRFLPSGRATARLPCPGRRPGAGKRAGRAAVPAAPPALACQDARGRAARRALRVIPAGRRPWSASCTTRAAGRRGRLRPHRRRGRTAAA